MGILFVVAVERGGGAADVHRVVGGEDEFIRNVHENLAASLDGHDRTAGALPDVGFVRIAAGKPAGLQFHQLDPGLVRDRLPQDVVRQYLPRHLADGEREIGAGPLDATRKRPRVRKSDPTNWSGSFPEPNAYIIFLIIF